MKPVSALLLVALSAMSSASFAAPPRGYFDAYFVTDSEIGDDDRKGDGYGLKGALSLAEQWFLTGEYQDVEYDDLVGDFDGDNAEDRIGTELNQLRLGLGYRAPVGGSTLAFVQAEYLDVEAEADVVLSNGGDTVAGSGAVDDDGYGIHAGLRGENGRLGVTVKIGFLDVADFDGPEYEIEADYRFFDWIGAFAGYRVTDLSRNDEDLKLKDLRVGVSVFFGG